MRRFAAKLGFVHRTLWQRDRLYRWAVLLGPPPLLGALVAALAWAGAASFTVRRPGQEAKSTAVPWAHWTRPVPQDTQPFVEAPSRPLPPTDKDGRFLGYGPGWVGAVQPFTVDATMDANVRDAPLAHFTLDQPSVPLDRIADAGPPTGLFVGMMQALFVARAPGRYAFSVRLVRSDTQQASCLIRFLSPHHSVLRNVALNVGGQASVAYPPTEFQLETGLLPLTVAVGCWRGDHVADAGELTLLVRRPGEQTLQPVKPDEVVRPLPHTAP